MATDEEIDKAIELIRSLRGDQRKSAWDRLLAKVPKSVYSEISGRQAKILHDQAETHKLPLKGERIDFRALAKAFHDLLAANAGQFGATAEKLENQKLEIELKRLKVDQAQFERDQRANKFVDRDQVSAVLGQLCFWLRSLGERMGRKHGPQIQRSINDQIEKIANDLEKMTK